MSLAVFSSVGVAGAAVVERVVAVVGEDAILLSDLRERARPFLIRIQQQVPAGAQRNAATSQVYREVLDRMIDERLEEKAANRARIVVTSREIDAAIERVAAQNGLPVEQLVSEAVRSGMTEQQYRDEMKRQLVDAKLMNLRLQGRIRITDDDTRAEYRQIVREERARLGFRIAWVVLDASDAAREKATRALADRITREARGGADFAGLAREHSVDRRTRERGGLLGRTTPGRLPAPIDRAVLALEVGEVSAPIRNGKELVIVKLIERDEGELPTYDEALAELQNRVYLRKMEKARRSWLDGLRRQSHVEVRL